MTAEQQDTRNLALSVCPLIAALLDSSTKKVRGAFHVSLRQSLALWSVLYRVPGVLRNREVRSMGGFPRYIYDYVGSLLLHVTGCSSYPKADAACANYPCMSSCLAENLAKFDNSCCRDVLPYPRGVSAPNDIGCLYKESSREC